MKDFTAIKIALASPADVLSWSYGEVKTAETINYRSLRPEPGGLMSEDIFGPVRSYECYCGKYKKSRYKGIICDKCGVEVTSNAVRRERMGHIKLAVPTVHVWYIHGTTNIISLLLDITAQKLISVVYYLRYIVTEVDEDKREDAQKKIKDMMEERTAELKERFEPDIAKLQKDFDKAKETLEKSTKKGIELLNLQNKYDKIAKELALLKKDRTDAHMILENDFAVLQAKAKEIKEKAVLTEEEYRKFMSYNIDFFKVSIGAEAIRQFLSKINAEQELKVLKNQYNRATPTARVKIEKKIKIFRSVLKNNYQLDWLISDVIPVIPADLRPIVMLAGGRFAISGLNDLYRRVINRNNRLKELMEVGAPEVILRNEKRMLQEAVDALVDNLHRPNGRPVVNRMGQPYKSLAENLRGKEGRFRRNLLGKRVDYSGRAVIIPDSKLSLNQCGLPRLLALEMYKPFVIHQLIKRGIAENIRIANEMLEQYDSVVWDILEEEIKHRPVLLNRPPTLHKYNMQAFYPVLVEGSAIRINQLLCRAYAGDFDGDQMGVFLPLTDEALQEAKDKLLAKHNILKISDGTPIISLARDMILGLFYLTGMEDQGKRKDEELKYFASAEHALQADESGLVTLREPIWVMVDDEVVKTTVGRLILNDILPKTYPFVNDTLDGKKGKAVVKDVVLNYNLEDAVEFLDDIKDLGFKYATLSGYTLSLSDFIEPKDLPVVVTDAKKKEQDYRDQYANGLLTNEEKNSLIVQMWSGVMEQATHLAWENLPEGNNVKMGVESGAEGDRYQVRQILAMKGVLRDPEGNWVTIPVLGNFKRGLDAYEFFIAARANRKGMADSKLQVPEIGYLSNRLADVAQDVIVRMEDCGYTGPGLKIEKGETTDGAFAGRLTGRVAAQDIKAGKKVVVKKNELMNAKQADEIVKAGITEAYIRSPLHCQSPLGICAHCYGDDLSTYKMVDVGVATGILAAQSIAETATQMTLDIFKKGGVGVDITAGFPRIVELFEARNPKFAGIMATLGGKVTIDGRKVSIKGKRKRLERVVINDSMELLVKDKQAVARGESLVKLDNGTIIKSPIEGLVAVKGRVISIEGEVEGVENLNIPEYLDILVANGDKVEMGQPLTDGHFSPQVIARYRGMEAAQVYVLDEVQKVHADFGISVNDKHVEVIVRQMAKIAKVVDPGDTGYVEGQFVSRYLLDARNKVLEKDSKLPITYASGVFGVTVVSVNADSVLSAMSFERVVQVLTDATLLGRVDYLRGLKENTMIGRLIPVGENARIKDINDLEEMKF